MGEDALGEDDHGFLEAGAALDDILIAQGRWETRSLDQTLDRAWRVASALPRRQLSMLPSRLVDAHYVEGTGDGSSPTG